MFFNCDTQATIVCLFLFVFMSVEVIEGPWVSRGGQFHFSRPISQLLLPFALAEFSEILLLSILAVFSGVAGSQSEGFLHVVSTFTLIF